jgi:hypothetical protein
MSPLTLSMSARSVWGIDIGTEIFLSHTASVVCDDIFVREINLTTQISEQLVGHYGVVRPAKIVRCPVCDKPGRHKINSITKRFRYPMDVVWVPKEESIHSISDAWRFAAMVCLHQSQMVLKFPPDTNLDWEAAAPLYTFFLTPMKNYTAKDLAKFESTHEHLIEQRLAPVKKRRQEAIIAEDRQANRLPDYDQLSFGTDDSERISTAVPENSGVVTHLSLALLFGSIVCTVISRSTYSEESQIAPSDQERLAAKAICTHFSLIYSDERTRKDWISWFEIARDALRDGVGKALRKHATKMHDGSIEKLSRRHVIDKSPEVLQKAQDVVDYSEIFDDLFVGFGRYIRGDPARAAGFVRDFEELQFSVYDQQMIYRYAWVVHDNGERHEVSPSASLQIIEKKKGAAA